MAADRPTSGPRTPIGLMVVGSEMVSFTLFGLFLDYLLNTMPGFTIGLTLFGVVAAFYHLVLMAKRMAAPKPGPPPDGGQA